MSNNRMVEDELDRQKCKTRELNAERNVSLHYLDNISMSKSERILIAKRETSKEIIDGMTEEELDKHFTIEILDPLSKPDYHHLLSLSIFEASRLREEMRILYDERCIKIKAKIKL